jgi:hypothetical protein
MRWYLQSSDYDNTITDGRGRGWYREAQATRNLWSNTMETLGDRFARSSGLHFNAEESSVGTASKRKSAVVQGVQHYQGDSSMICCQFHTHLWIAANMFFDHPPTTASVSVPNGYHVRRSSGFSSRLASYLCSGSGEGV